MRAEVTDGEGAVFASGRALFVAPNLGKAFQKGLQGGKGAAAAAAAAAAGQQQSKQAVA